MNLILYNNSAEQNRVNKNAYLSEIVHLNGTLRDQSSIVDPIITIELNPKDIEQKIIKQEYIVKGKPTDYVVDNTQSRMVYDFIQQVLSANYARILEFNRYYFVVDIVSVRSGLWLLKLKCDVLMSFKSEILALTCNVERQENDYNSKIGDNEVEHPEFATVQYINPFTYFSFDTETGALIDRYVLTCISSYENTSSITANGISRGGGMNFRWCFEVTSFSNLSHEMSNDSFWADSGLKNVFANNPVDGIISLRVYPFSVSNWVDLPAKTKYVPIEIGKYTSDVVTAKDLYTHADADCEKLVASFNFASLDEWYDYELASYDLFLPFYGFVEISPADLCGYYINVWYVIDFDTGKASIQLYKSTRQTTTRDRNGSNTNYMFKSVECQIGVDIPYSSTNNAERIRNTALSAIGGVAAGFINPAMGVGVGLSGVARNIAPDIRRGGGAKGPWGYFFATNHCYMVKTYKTPLYNSEFYKTHGRPLYSIRLLGSLSGYTRTGDVHMENFTIATYNELREIESLLKSGVII